MKALICLIVLLFFISVSSFTHVAPPCRRTSPIAMKVEGASVPKALSALVISGGLFVTPVLPSGLLGRNPLVSVANADFRAAQKRTYFRYAPKLVDGTSFYEKELKSAIAKDDWKVVENMFKEYTTKVDGSDKKTVTQTDTFVNSRFLRPMLLLSGTFAERGTSPKQRDLQAQLDAYTLAMKSLQGSVMDMPGEGFFSGKKKAPTGSERKKQAMEAYKAGREALNSYIRIFNEGLMMELTKLEPIP